ncbi:licD family protein [Hirsutella rhossiliensis]|uniref:LicD family domain-containing protein n=1 Tax=Hirsutella rhossiliensis TaxID=111463 RepID=A0A9P8N2A3_9HYPO|nr:licD family domain-containing protein [Hirsutella rhossiliensis]KAH0966343.1 licD family domain-containing protein [Hirsutella rhossiliensis]
MPSLRTLLVAGLAAMTAAAAPGRAAAAALDDKPSLAPRSPYDADASGSGSGSGSTVVARDEPGHTPLTPKYFHEPGGSLSRGHYDQRYFQREVEYAEHRVVLRDLVRSYLATMHAHGVETWLAHGTLLGWWWNGRVMPWDYDLDVQVSNDTLQWLADHLNRTEHPYRADAHAPAKTYLLDVNPHHVDVTRGDGMNIIDARWIDMANGMFIDITGLRERDPALPGYWSCKNAHRYASQDLWPMRLTDFEGARARIPYSFEKILSVEYGPKSLVTEEHAGHRWDRATKEWVIMTPEEKEKRQSEARERKRLQMVRDGRLPAP